MNENLPQPEQPADEKLFDETIFNPKVDLGRCALCPQAKLHTAKITGLNDFKTSVEQGATDPDVETIARELSEIGIVDLTPDETVQSFREHAAGVHGALSDELGIARQALHRLISSCPHGPLSMRAARDGTRYTATVCTSQAAITSEDTGGLPEPVNVRREQIES